MPHISYEIELVTEACKDEDNQVVFRNRIFIPCVDREDALRLRDLLDVNVVGSLHHYTLSGGVHVERRAEVMVKFYLDRSAVRMPASHAASAAAHLRALAEDISESTLQRKKPLRSVAADND